MIFQRFQKGTLQQKYWLMVQFHHPFQIQQVLKIHSENLCFHQNIIVK